MKRRRGKAPVGKKQGGVDCGDSHCHRRQGADPQQGDSLWHITGRQPRSQHEDDLRRENQDHGGQTEEQAREEAVDLEKQRGAFGARPLGQHGDKGEDDRADESLVERVDGADRYRQRIGGAMGA